MSSNQLPRSMSSLSIRDRERDREKTYFEQQREALIGEIAMSFEHVLANINKLNRSLEAVVAVGNEFSSVEALWSQFENVMAKDPEDGKTGSEGEEGQGQQGEGETTTAGKSS
ncbi:DASH complex subunit Dad1-domain-containing protein [Annulohypoxylon moriforme]|nr:DASH complex subunit Dad1-domain-containing protein [Annulohypoxylon moriforme]